MKICRYLTTHNMSYIKTRLAEITNAPPYHIQIVDNIDIENRFGCTLFYNENTTSPADGERNFYVLIFDLTLHIVLIMGTSVHREYILNKFMSVIEGMYWSDNLQLEENIGNEYIHDLILQLRSNSMNIAEKILMISETSALIMPVGRKIQDVPYYSLDFGFDDESAETHPLMQFFIQNATTMGFIMRLDSCKGLRPIRKTNRTRLDVKPNYTFRVYMDIPYEDWLIFLDTYLMNIINRTLDVTD